MNTDTLYSRNRLFANNALLNARQQADARNFDDFVIVDVDSHHSEGQSWSEITKHFDDGPFKIWAEGPRAAHSLQGGGGGGSGNQHHSDRMIRAGQLIHDPIDDIKDGRHRDVVRTTWAMDMMGIDYTVLFPGGMLGLGLNPIIEAEVAIARAYNRWLTKELLPQDDRIKIMAYLPFNDPKESLKFVEEFNDEPGVVGFVVTSIRHVHVHHNDYAPVYQAIQDTGKPLAFHAFYNWGDTALNQLDKFISIHSLGFVLANLIHMTNWVINGMPERFPRLKTMWIESGLAWIPFLMQRLDNEYMMRTAEAPLLTKLPSEYMREMFYSSQPMEQQNNSAALQTTFDMIDAPNQLLFSTDYPHWDFNVPSTVYDLPFLDESQKRAILGGNACKLFGIDPTASKFNGGGTLKKWEALISSVSAASTA